MALSPREKPAALYARVSTREQSPEMQLRELRELAAKRGWPVHQEYRDIAVSGIQETRPALNALLEEARRGRFKVVLIWKLDRLARSVAHLLRLAEEFRALGIDLVSATESVDTTIPSGRVLFTVLGAIAEFERDLIRERVKAGMRAAKRSGKRIGRPRLQPTEGEAQELLALRAEGFSIRQIAARVSWFPANSGRARNPSPSHVHRVLRAIEKQLHSGEPSRTEPRKKTR